jgi:hypothetical protein
MLKMRGWFFLKKKSLGGSPCRCQSFSDSVYETTKLGAKNPNNPRHLVCWFDEVLRKMRLEHADLTSNFPSPVVVASRKPSKKKGKEGEPLTKHLRGVSIEEKDLLAADKCSIKIRYYFEKCHLGVGAACSVFSDCVERECYLCIPLCDSLFKTCTTENGYVSVLHNALRAFHGVCSTAEDGMQLKKTWIDHPELFMEQVQLKFGKPGMHSSEVCEEAVASNSEELMNDNEKKTGGVHTALDNAVLIRFRVLCFFKQKRVNSVAANKLNKLKKKDVLASKEEPSAKMMSPIESPPSVLRKEAPGFLKLLHSQDEGKPPASHDSSTRLDEFVKLVVAAAPNPGTPGAVSQESTETNHLLPPDLDDDVGIGDDPGPFELASPEKVAAFGPVLVMFPESGDFDVVLVEVSPLDLRCRERLRPDVHAMTHLTNVLSLEDVTDGMQLSVLLCEERLRVGVVCDSPWCYQLKCGDHNG